MGKFTAPCARSLVLTPSMSKAVLKPEKNPQVRGSGAILKACLSPWDVSRDALHSSLKRWPEEELKHRSPSSHTGQQFNTGSFHFLSAKCAPAVAGC